MASSDYQAITECRSCSSQNLVDILDLGVQPLANDFLSDPDSVQQCYPLSVAFCRDCSLLQLKQTVRKEALFDRYVWLTGTSRTARDYARTFSARVLESVKLSRSDLIIEIASNDGTVLRPFVDAGFSVLGVEPAKNVAEIALASGVQTLCAYWSRETAESIVGSHNHAKVIIARNVIPHVSNLHEVISAAYYALDEDGIGIIEFHDGCTILKDLHYDSIYHEHLCYFTIRSIATLLARFNLYPFHIETSPISGGSHVMYFSKKPDEASETYLHAVTSEENSMCNDLTSWKVFAGRCAEHKAKTIELISQFEDKTVVGFGASARSSTYLNYCVLTADAITAVIDNNLLKQGLYTPGSNIPIVSIEKGMSLKPELIFILAWNFKDEIIQECQDRGFKGHYLTPFPQYPILLATESI
ncbi:MAG: class I SAM-dependent methyltransferase [Vulcanimicrobiota bacterium]